MRLELRAMVSLAWPVILAEIGWVLMGVVDTIFVGPLGPAVIGGVGIGSTLFFAVMVFGSGLFFALDTFVAQSFGAGRIAGVSSVAVRGARAGRRAVGRARRRRLRRRDACCRTPAFIRTCSSCCSRISRALLWSAPPLFLFTVFRRYLQAMNIVRPILVGVVVMNLVNALGNWVFVYGHLGIPAMGAVGSAYATVGARVALAVFLVGRDRSRRTSAAVGSSRRAADDSTPLGCGGSSGSERPRRCSWRSKWACSRPRRRWPDASRRWRLPPTRWC